MPVPQHLRTKRTANSPSFAGRDTLLPQPDQTLTPPIQAPMICVQLTSAPPGPAKESDDGGDPPSSPSSINHDIPSTSTPILLPPKHPIRHSFRPCRKPPSESDSSEKTYVDSAIQKKDELSQERQRNALAKAILSRFCPCKARDDIEIHMKHQGDTSRLATRLQNYIHQQNAFKEELISTYGPQETTTLIQDYAWSRGTIEGDICVGDLHNFTAFWRIARLFIENQGPNHFVSEEDIPKLKSTTPGSVVFSLYLQHRLMITKTDIWGSLHSAER